MAVIGNADGTAAIRLKTTITRMISPAEAAELIRVNSKEMAA